MLSVTILGSGAATPTLGRHCSSQVVAVDGERMLLDCGEATQNQIRLYHQKLQSFSHIFISHLHGDHWFGLPGLLASMHLCGRTDDVHVYAPAGIRPALELLFEVSGTHLQYELHLHELEGGRQTVYEADKCRVSAFPIVHSMPTYGYLFEEKIPLFNLRKDSRAKYGLTDYECRRIKMGDDYVRPDGSVVPNAELVLPKRQPLRYAYCCDTAYSESVIAEVRGVDLLCVDSTFDSAHEALAAEKLHCTAHQAAQMALAAHAKQLMLTHFSARYKDVSILLDEARKVFPNTIAAEEGETKSL